MQLERAGVEHAGKTVADALALPVHEPDVHLVAGLLEQQRGNWHQMDDHYDEAARGFVERGTQVGLLRAAPPNLQWRMARHLSASDTKRALEYVVEAVRAGILGKGEFPERKALADKARIEERLGLRAASARTYGAAADCYAWSDATTRALNLYQKACELAPEDVELAWAYAEALRGQVEDEDTVVDRGIAQAARDVLRDASARRQPEPPHAWVLATDALLGVSLGDPTDEMTMLVERALMLDASRAVLFALLITMLRMGGYTREAVEAGESALQVFRRDPQVVEAAAAARADAGDLSGALQLLDDQPEPDASVAVRAANLLLHLDHPQVAVDRLDAAPPSDPARLVRGLALEAQGNLDRAGAEFELIWANVSRADAVAQSGARRTAAMAAYHTGRYDAAVDILRELADQGPRDTAFRLDLGTVLIVRGDADGSRLLIDTIEACTMVEDLMFLDRIDIPGAKTRVAGTPHEGTALDTLEAAAASCKTRIAWLRGVIRPDDSLARRAARAREALADGRFEEAADRYLELLNEAPEAQHALARAIDALTAEGDRLQQAGRGEEGRRLWAAAVAGAAATDNETATRLRARIVISQLADDGPAPAPEAVSNVLAGAEPVASLRAALTLCVHDLGSAWRLRERVLALRDGFASAPHRQLLVDAADTISLDAVYQLDQKAVPAGAMFPIFTPVEVRLPANRVAPMGYAGLGDAIAKLRGQLAVDTGIRVPGIRFQSATQPPAEELTVTIYGMCVHRQVAPEDKPLDAGQVAAVVGSVLQSHMHRMIGTDDVELWLAGWDDPLSGQWHTTLDSADRLRLARVLRRLLRERVPVVDRTAIMAGFAEAQEAGESTSGILRAVRKRLRADVLCGGPGRTRHPLPERLAERIEAHVDGTAWRSSRSAAADLLVDLRAWRSALPADAVVTVGNHVLRSIVWKLLVSAGVPAAVLSSEEDAQ